MFTLLLQSLDVAHEAILKHEGGLTTLCAALVAPLKDSKQFVVCIVNVGDSLGFVFSKHHGIREITTGSHDIESERDIRDAGGALGPVNGQDPELNNLTCSMTVVDPGDIIYLTTDGISDNFDPVVTKIAVPKRCHSDPELNKENSGNNQVSNPRHSMISHDGRPEMSPHERHQYAVKEMERIIHEFELFTEECCSAQELCGALLQHVLTLTDPKRKVLENPDLYGKKLRSKDRKRRDSEIVSKMSRAPGKLDHATIVAYEVGNYHGNEDEDYEIDSTDDELDGDGFHSNQGMVGKLLTYDAAIYGRKHVPQGGGGNANVNTPQWVHSNANVPQGGGGNVNVNTPQGVNSIATTPLGGNEISQRWLNVNGSLPYGTNGVRYGARYTINIKDSPSPVQYRRYAAHVDTSTNNSNTSPSSMRGYNRTISSPNPTLNYPSPSIGSPDSRPKSVVYRRSVSTFTPTRAQRSVSMYGSPTSPSSQDASNSTGSPFSPFSPSATSSPNDPPVLRHKNRSSSSQDRSSYYSTRPVSILSFESAV